MSIVRIASVALMMVLLCGSACSGLHEEADKTRQALLESARTLADAVPGEVFIRLLMQAHDPNPQVSTPAKNLIKSMYGIEFEQAELPWTLEVTVTTPTAVQDGKTRPPLRWGITQTPVITELSVEEARRFGFIPSLEEARVSGWREPSADEIRLRVKQNVQSAIDELVGTPTPASPKSYLSPTLFNFPQGLLSHVHDVDLERRSVPVGRSAGPVTTNTQIIASKQKIVDTISNAILGAYNQIQIPDPSLSKSITWRMPDGNALLVFIDEDSWKAYDRDIEIRYRLRSNSNPPVYFTGTNEFQRIPIGNFEEGLDGEVPRFTTKRYSDAPDKITVVRWAFANVTKQHLSLAALNQLQETLKEVRKQP